MADYKDPEKHALDDGTTHRRVSITDAVFGEISDEGPNYRAVRTLREFLDVVTDHRRSVGKAQLCSC